MKYIRIIYPDYVNSWSFVVELVEDDVVVWADVVDTLDEALEEIDNQDSWRKEGVV